MTNILTSITSAASGATGIATELVQAVWDLVVGEALRELPTSRVIVDKRPERPMSKGSSVTMEKFEWFTAAAITAMLTPLTEESDVDSVGAPQPSHVIVTPAEYGAAVTRTRKLDNRTFAPVDPYLARLVADAMNRTIDGLVQAAIIADTTPVLIGGGSTVNDVIITDVLTASELRKAVTRLRTNKAVPWFGNFYGGLVHPHVILDLREATGAGSWRVPNEYGASQERIWAGEIGEFEGIRFIENALVSAADNTVPNAVYQNYIFGRGAVAENVIVEPSVVIGPQVDKLRRFHTVGWYGDLGFKVYEPKAIQRLVSGSSMDS
jgi:N4-gp56 family major capsid protein